MEITNYDPAVRKYVRNTRSARPKHATRREGDEMACSCGARWEVGEDHP